MRKTNYGFWKCSREGTTWTLLVLSILVLFTSAAMSEEKVKATLFKNPQCTCCDKYAAYLRSNGFDVAVVTPPNMSAIKRKYGVREDLEGCHTTIVGDYAVEGHVPTAPIKRLLAERPPVKGISLPGMPAGSPGMSGSKEGSFEILAITGSDAPAPVYAKE